LGFVTQVNFALLLRSAGRLDESIAVYKLAFDLYPDAAPEYRQDYLVSYCLKGQYDHAEAIRRTARQISAEGRMTEQHFSPMAGGSARSLVFIFIM
jgi:tetratricopeptide (TPR) repeat protein